MLTARDGTQKRLPTDTSCKLSVFQTALSTIMVHTEDNMIPTVELMDAIIDETKPDRDHARRLRLAVGETPAEHRERLANDKVGAATREVEPSRAPVIVPTLDELRRRLCLQESRTPRQSAKD